MSTNFRSLTSTATSLAPPVLSTGNDGRAVTSSLAVVVDGPEVR
ncbi:MAG TPA: hypothetical protein VHY91_09905 [Pirellulales bacterium]|jgi:hypothetical protein|nr:hypothetical protein [Pirellulales bacterium]